MAKSAGSFSLKWDGKITKEVRAAAVEGLWDATDSLLADSSQLVPHAEGTLEMSGDNDVDPSTLTGTVSYNTPYAVRQHEDLTARHPNGRQAKYLEQPARERADEYLAHIAKRMRDAIK